MPRAPRAVSAMVLMDLCHLPSLHQQPGHSSHPREPDPQSLLTAQLPGKRSEYPLTLKKATFPLNSWKTYHFFFTISPTIIKKLYEYVKDKYLLLR